MTDGCQGVEFEPAHRGNDIEPGLAFDADWLKGERVVEPADQAVSSGSDADRSSARSADISAGERPRADVRGGRENGPGHARVAGKSDLRAEALDGALIVLGWGAARWGEDAIIRSRRINDLARCARASAAQHTDLDGGVRRHRGKGKAKQGGGERSAGTSFDRHDIPFNQHAKTTDM